MDFLVIVLASFFGLFLCLGLILMKWIVTQLGATLCFLILFLSIAIFLLAMGDKKHDYK